MVLSYPEAALRQKGREIEATSDEVQVVAARMIELMFEADGIGLAAPQVGLPWRLFVCHVPPTGEGERDEIRSAESDPPSATPSPRVYINPVLSSPSQDLVSYEEGCLSLPDIRGDVLRPREITVTAVDLEGRAFSHRAGGLLARCLQHEYDHLDGVLIIDRMSQLSRLKNRSAVRKLEREHRL
jgi:peptide deformylase